MGIFSILIMVYTNFPPSPFAFSYPSPLSEYVTKSPIFYNEQLESNGFRWNVNSFLFFFFVNFTFKRCINYYFFFNNQFHTYLVERNLSLWKVKIRCRFIIFCVQLNDRKFFPITISRIDKRLKRDRFNLRIYIYIFTIWIGWIL